MTKLVSIITTAAIAGTMAMAGAMSSFAAEEAAGAEIQQSIQEAQTEIPESSSPKTGVAAPSLPAAGIVLAFAAVVLTLKRKKN